MLSRVSTFRLAAHEILGNAMLHNNYYGRHSIYSQNHAHLEWTQKSVIDLGDAITAIESCQTVDSPSHIHTAQILGVPRLSNEPLNLLAHANFLRAEGQWRRGDLQTGELIVDGTE